MRRVESIDDGLVGEHSAPAKTAARPVGGAEKQMQVLSNDKGGRKPLAERQRVPEHANRQGKT